MENLLVCTFSGGRTSAFMGRFILESKKYESFEKVFIFANTGKEREETLMFVDRCDKEWGLNIVWLEAEISKEKGVGTTYRVVDFETASRNGEPFEEMLKAYSMPNTFASNCTRELKDVPIRKYVKDLGFDNVFTAMGIRIDEQHRKSNFAKEKNIIYPLCDELPVDSKFIRNWWDSQPFDLELKDYEGNCDLCFKKSLKKRLTILKENPTISEWWEDMERKYSDEKVPRFDLRTNLSIEELVEMSKRNFTKAEDLHELDKKQASLFDVGIDCYCKAN